MFLHKHFLGADDRDNDRDNDRENEGEDKGEDADIRRNLDHVLSTKRGCSYFQDDFGLSDVAFRTAEEVVETLTREIKENIEVYEPRVKVVRIKEIYDDDGLKVRLEVVLVKRSNGRTLQMAVDLRKKKASFTSG
jgi:phage baseplate assembly protein W